MTMFIISKIFLSEHLMWIFNILQRCLFLCIKPDETCLVFGRSTRNINKKCLLKSSMVLKYKQEGVLEIC